MIYIGLDWARESHAFVVEDGTGKVLLEGTVLNRTDLLEEWACSMERLDGDITLGLESGNGLATPVEECARARGWVVRRVAASAVKTYREHVLGKINKTDRLDCLAIVGLVRNGSSTTRSTDHQELRRFCRDRAAVVALKTKHANRLRAVLAEYIPELTLNVVPNICAVGLLHLLSIHPDPLLWRELGVENISLLLKAKGVRSHTTFLRKLVDVAKTFKPHGSPSRLRVLQREAQMLSRRLIRCLEDLSDVEELISLLAADDGAVQAVMRIPGAGPTLAPAIVAEIKNIADFPSEAHLASYAGLGLAQHQTGKSTNYWKPQTRANRRLRNCMLQLALTNPRFSTLSANYIERKLLSKSPLQARRALARQLIRLIYRTLRFQALGTARRSSPIASK